MSLIDYCESQFAFFTRGCLQYTQFKILKRTLAKHDKISSGAHSKKRPHLAVFGSNLIYLCFSLLRACGQTGETFKAKTPVLVKTGLDRVGEYSDLFKDKRIGIVTNHTAYNSQQKHVIDIFLGMKDVSVTALFGPRNTAFAVREKREKNQF